MSDTAIVITGGTFPNGYCPASYQALLNDIVARLSGYVPNGIKGVVISATTPVAEDQDKLWIKLSGTSPIGWFTYDMGSWLRPHEVTPSSNKRFLWVGTPTELETEDGGSSGAVGPTTGPFWEIDTDFAGRIPMGVGTMPDSTAIALGENLGHDKITLTKDQIPVLPISWKASQNAGGFGADVYSGASDVNWGFVGDHNSTPVTQSDGPVKIEGLLGQPFTNLSPVRGAYWIRRTARVYYVA